MSTLAVVGATGLVGRTVLKILEEKELPINKYIFLASKSSAGKEIKFKNTTYKIQELTSQSFNGIDYAIFVAGGEVSKKFIPIAIDNNCIAIDNSSTYRLEKNVPLVVPEVNANDVYFHNGIIANPNCSTIQSVIPLNLLKKNYGIKRVIYSTYQAVSGAGKKGIDDLINTSKGLKPLKFSVPIYNNCIPQIDTFLSNGYTKEEEKMINETRKILKLPSLKITATAIRVPVQNSHCISANVELENEFNINDVLKIFSKQENLIIKNNCISNINKLNTAETKNIETSTTETNLSEINMAKINTGETDNVKTNLTEIHIAETDALRTNTAKLERAYPVPTDANGTDNIFIGRIRRDFSTANALNYWVVADNLRKGAATNAIQILELLINK